MKPGMKQLLAAVIAVFFRIAICVHGFSVASALPALSPVITSQKPQRPKSSRMRSAGKESFTANMDKDSSSKRSLLRFAIPALGIYLSNPLLSNIDNIFVGRTAGTKALAAMSPATTLTDLLLMTFSFLGRAATGIVTRAYALKEGKGNTEAASKAASAPLTMALVCGIGLTIAYEFLTPKMMATLGVNPKLRTAASSYIYLRGSTAWAALIQTVFLSCILVTRDSLTPLKIVGVAALVNVCVDALSCVWPFRYGCAGAAVARALSTLVNCSLMYKAMEKKGISPRIKLPTVKEIRALLQFTGPLMTITLTRIGGFFAMQRKAMSLGMQSLAGYQVCIHMMMFFLLFGEPLSQLSQTELPTLLDEGNGVAAWRTLKSVITITSSTALCVASAAFVLARFGTGAFSSDSDVQMIAQSTAPTLFLTIAVAVASVSFDGAQIASKDFSYMLVAGFATFFMQLKLLPYCTSVKQIFATFALRMGIYAMFSVLRTLFGYGGVGRVLYKTSQKMSDSRSPA